ncbi:hypothetical protein FF38_03341 [Lucilia cuprina]|uniref:Uncharacterized protein n=1 Tax=Lucilia cuprina TaxID=7375 RepID=A0A0L0C239_LUCCU|nr:hypothetical protein FF38_03341 [Lucilia cuprina]
MDLKKYKAFIEDLMDVIKLTGNMEKYLFGTEFLQEISKSDVPLPILKNKERKVITKIKMLEKELEGLVEKHSHYISAYHDSTINSVMSNNQAMLLFHKIEFARHRIDSMYRQMLCFLKYQYDLEIVSILEMTKWFVSPNSNSVSNILNLLHLTLVDGKNPYMSGLNVLERYYQVSSLT